LDNNKYVAAILMDLSKAFDCFPHNLLIEKLKTYSLSDKALTLASFQSSTILRRAAWHP
jgi:hypothetical protein